MLYSTLSFNVRLQGYANNVQREREGKQVVPKSFTSFAPVFVKKKKKKMFHGLSAERRGVVK
jgi:hypothetical protein